jgi:hypothetical protein
MIFAELHWTISLGIWVGIITVLLSILWTWRQLQKEDK